MAKKLAPFSALQKAKDYINSKLNTKVDKVSGKGLSTNDYTTTEKNKLSGIASGAEVNVQSDWNQSTTTADDYIKNKPLSLPASDVYAWAKASTKPSYSASEVGLGNVGNFKAVSTVANQGLSTTEKQNARNNIDVHVGDYSTTTVNALYTDIIKGKGIFFGSTHITADSVLPDTWYNFQWIPHRDGTAEGDNSEYGNFIFYSMTSTSKIYVVRFSNASRAETIEIPKKTDIPTKVSQLTNDSGYTTNTGTITGITMNGASKGTSGVVDLGTVLTQHQDISGKVDKISGKGLSTNDYTTTEKNKLAGIASGAEVNVQSDWNQSTTTADDYIKNKPSSMPASDVYAWAKASTKPSYSASEVGAIATTARGAVNGVASLGSDGKVPSSQLPESGGIQEITLWENADPSQNQAETSIANPLVATPAGMKMLRVYYVTKYSSDNKSNKVKDLPLVPVGWSGDRMWVRSSIIDWGNCTDSYHNTNRYNCVLGRDIMYYASSVVPDTYPNGFIKIGGGYYASMDVAYNPQSYPSMTGDFADAMIVTKITALVY